MNVIEEVANRLQGAADQVGHPDYSLAEFRQHVYHAVIQLRALNLSESGEQNAAPQASGSGDAPTSHRSPKGLEVSPAVAAPSLNDKHRVEGDLSAARDNADYWRRKYHNEAGVEEAAQKVMEWADRIGGFEAKLLAEEIRSIDAIIAHALDESLEPRNRLQGVIARLEQMRPEITDGMVDRALEAAEGAMVDTRRFWTEQDRAAVRAMLRAAFLPSASGEESRDAARYRWLRENADEVFAGEAVEWQVKYGRLPAQLDDAIDAAIVAAESGRKE